MNEKTLERKLVVEVRKKKGRAVKFPPFFESHFPDRLILMPGGKASWAETKTTGEKLSQGQLIRKAELEQLGFKVYVIDDNESLKNCLDDL